MPQSGAGISRSAGTCSRPLRIRAATCSVELDGLIAEIEHAENDRLARDRLQHAQIEPGLRRLDRDLVSRAVGERLQERVAAAALVVHQLGVAEAHMQRLGSRHADEGAIDRPERVARRDIGRGLDPGLVDLNDVGARALEVVRLLVHRRREIHHELLLVVVELVLGLARHRERPGQRDLDPAVGVAAQELDVAQLDRMPAPDLPCDPRHPARVAAPPGDGSGVVDVDPVERRGEAVRVALAAHLAIGDDVDAGPLHVADREQRRVVLRLLEPGFGHPPDFWHAHARHQRAQQLAVDQPLGLRIAADHGRRQDAIGPHQRPSSRIATARVKPAEAPLMLNGKQHTEKPVAGSASRLCSFSRWQ